MGDLEAWITEKPPHQGDVSQKLHPWNSSHTLQTATPKSSLSSENCYYAYKMEEGPWESCNFLSLRDL